MGTGAVKGCAGTLDELHCPHSGKCSTYLASNMEIWLVLERAFKHATIILYEVEVDSSLASRPVRIFHQSLRI